MKIKFIFLPCSEIAFSVTSYTQAFVSEKNTGAGFPAVTASQTTFLIKTTSHSAKIPVHFNDLQPSYLGPEETIFKSKNN